MHQIARYFQKHSSPLLAIPTAAEAVLPSLTEIKCVAFDIYGTLIISGSGDLGLHDANHHSELLRKLLLQAGAKALPESPLDSFRGHIQASHQISRAKGVEHPEVDILEIWTALLKESQAPPLSCDTLELLATRYELASNPVWPMTGSREVLRTLRECDLRMALVSNAQFYTPHLFEAFFGAPLEELGFDPDLCFFSYQDKQAKPGTFLYRQLREALAKQEIAPEETLYLGNDMLKDIHPAATLGFKTALFAGDARSLRLREDSPGLHQPDAVVTELEQIASRILPPKETRPATSLGSNRP